jgi:uncharacterized repeat protein (TIGR01451 family)
LRRAPAALRAKIAAAPAAAVLLLSAAAGPAWAAIAFDYANSASGQTSALSWSHTVGAGSDRLLLVGIAIDNPARTVGTVKWGGPSGTALTYIGRRQGNATTVEIWGLKDPAGGTAEVYATISGGSSEWMVGGSASYTGVDQAAPWSGFVSAAGRRGDGETPSLTVSSASGGLVFDAIAINDDQLETYSASVGAGQTSVWNRKVDAQSIVGGASTEAGAASVAMTWSFPTTDYIWAYAALSINAAAAAYRPDAQIKLSSEGAGSYCCDGVYETAASTQAKAQGVVSGSPASYNILFENDSTDTDSLLVTQASASNCSNYTIRYLDDSSTDRTIAVTGSGYTISGLAPGAVRTWTLNVTPAASINGSSPACVVSVTAASSGDGTKTDQVEAATSSVSASLTLSKSADRATAAPGQDIVYTVDATNGSGLTDASTVVLTDPIPAHTGFKVGSASFSAGTSTLSGTASYSSDSGATWSHSPASGGCTAPTGYDYCVTHIRWTPTGTMPTGTSFSVSFTVGVK